MRVLYIGNDIELLKVKPDDGDSCMYDTNTIISIK